MRRGLIFPGGGMTMADICEIAQEAEQKGVDSLYCVEAWREAFVPLAAIATVTERVRIGSYVLNAYGRTPFMTGMSAVDLDELCGGRLLVGIGSGNRHINEAYQGSGARPAADEDGGVRSSFSARSSGPKPANRSTLTAGCTPCTGRPL